MNHLMLMAIPLYGPLRAVLPLPAKAMIKGI